MDSNKKYKIACVSVYIIYLRSNMVYVEKMIKMDRLQQNFGLMIRNWYLLEI